MWALPCDVYDLEPGSCYENEEPVLACRETVSRGRNCQSLRIPLDALHSIRPECETLVLRSIYHRKTSAFAKMD
jgi:hypothetical protein